MDAVNAVTAETSVTVAAMRAAHAQALAQHYPNSASSSSMSSQSMVIDSHPEYDAEAKAEAAALHQRLRQRELAALRRLANERTIQQIAADSQKYAKQDQVRAKAAAATDPYNDPTIPLSRRHVGKAYREPEYQNEITRYMVDMDVSRL